MKTIGIGVVADLSEEQAQRPLGRMIDCREGLVQQHQAGAPRHQDRQREATLLAHAERPDGSAHVARVQQAQVA